MTDDADNEKNKSAYHSNFEGSTSIDVIVIMYCVLNTPLMLISILGNTLVLAAIIRTPSIHSTSMIMLCSLAVSDLFVGVLAQPLFITQEVTKDEKVIYRLSKIIGSSLCGISLCTITAITVDRYLALHYHLRYATLVTKSRVQFAVIVVWLTIVVLANFHFANEPAFNRIAASFIVVCVVISAFSYIRIFLIVRQHHSQIHIQQQAVQSFNAGNNLNTLRLKRSAVNTFVFYIALIVCYMPMYILLSFYDIPYKNLKTEWGFATTVVFMNSAMNPFLYCWRLGELRKAVVKIARHFLCTKRDQE